MSGEQAMTDTAPLTDQQREYNTAQAELFQLAVYGHSTHWPTGTGHPSEYIDAVRAAQERFEAAVLAVVQPECTCGEGRVGSGDCE